MAKFQKNVSFVTVLLGTIGTIAGVTAVKPTTVYAPQVEPTEAILVEDNKGSDTVVVSDNTVIAGVSAEKAITASQKTEGEANVRKEITKPEVRTATQKKQEVVLSSDDDTTDIPKNTVPSADDEIQSIIEGNHLAYSAIAATKEKDSEKAKRRFVDDVNRKARNAVTVIPFGVDDYDIEPPCCPPESIEETDDSVYTEEEDSQETERQSADDENNKVQKAVTVIPSEVDDCDIEPPYCSSEPVEETDDSGYTEEEDSQPYKIGLISVSENAVL